MDVILLLMSEHIGLVACSKVLVANRSINLHGIVLLEYVRKKLSIKSSIILLFLLFRLFVLMILLWLLVLWWTHPLLHLRVQLGLFPPFLFFSVSVSLEPLSLFELLLQILSEIVSCIAFFRQQSFVTGMLLHLSFVLFLRENLFDTRCSLSARDIESNANRIDGW